MTPRVNALLSRARTELEVAQLLHEAGFHEQASSRAYYAAFYAAEAALLVIGESRSKHSGVISAFHQLVIKEGGLDPDTGAALSQLFDRRNVADYSWLDHPLSAQDPASIAQPFVDAVAQWIAARSG